jgi:two-component system, chemotaxis family, sensor kinase CheA
MARVLVVDDSRTVRELHRRALEAAGFEVSLAEDGFDALMQLSQDGSIGLVVTDLEMGEMDGLMLTEAIRTRESHHGLPIVVVSSDEQDSVRERAIAAGADAYIVKRGFSWSLLVRTVERLLSGAGFGSDLSLAV